MHNRSGFTLVEVLAVMAIFALSICLVSVFGSFNNRDAAGIVRDEHGGIYCPKCNVEVDAQWPHKCSKCDWQYQ